MVIFYRIGSQISALNLGGNNITSIDFNNGSVFSNASKSDGGSVNLAQVVKT